MEALFAERDLAAPFTLCPSTTDPALAREWLSWTAAGVEGLCFKRLEEPYRGGVRSWRKYKVRVTTEAVFPVKSLCSPLVPPQHGGARWWLWKGWDGHPTVWTSGSCQVDCALFTGQPGSCAFAYLATCRAS